MEITYLGHSAFRLRGKDVTIVTDPFPPEIGFTMGKPSADIVTVSHDSANHAFVSGVLGTPRLVMGPGEYEVADVLIGGVATDERPIEGAVNTAYVLRFDDVAVCHLGDIAKKLTDSQVEALGHVDALLVPVGGGGALGPSQAAEVVAQIEPAIVIPMHYRIDGAQAGGLGLVDLFVREMGAKEFVPEPKLTVTKSSLPADIRMIVLENRKV